MAVDRDDQAQRKARTEKMLEEARALRRRAGAARARARSLVVQSTELLRCEERRQQRDAALKRAAAALRMRGTSRETT